MKKRRKKKSAGGRLRSWFGNGKKSYNAARKALSARKKDGLEHHLAKVSKRRTGEIQYYVGKMHQIEGLKERFDVKVIR